MAKKAEEKKENTRRMCPNCGAYKWQGPYFRGEIVNDKHQEEEVLYTCVHCHQTRTIEEMTEVGQHPMAVEVRSDGEEES